MERNTFSLRVLLSAICVGFIFSGCNLFSTPKLKARKLLNKFKLKMIACYIEHEGDEQTRCQDQIMQMINQKQANSGISKEVFDHALKEWKSECEFFSDVGNFSVYLEQVRGTQNPMAGKIRELLIKEGFKITNLENGNLQDLANRYAVQKEQLENEVVVMYHENIKFLADKIQAALANIQSISKIKLLNKGTPHMYSVGIYVPAG